MLFPITNVFAQEITLKAAGIEPVEGPEYLTMQWIISEIDKRSNNNA